MKKIILLTILSFCFSLYSYCQNYSKNAEVFFKKFKTKSSLMAYIINNTPSMEECKYVFKGNLSYTYFAKLTEMKRKGMFQSNDTEQSFEGVKVESFTTEDIIAGKSNISIGMQSAKDFFHPGVIFYKVSFLRQKDAEDGIAYKYFIYINCKWLMFPKPLDIINAEIK